MKTYLLAATAVIFLSVIVSLLIPEGKLNKTIVFVMRMACIFVLIQPVTGIFKLSTSSTDAPLYDYELVCRVYSDNQSEQLNKLIDEKFDTESSCRVNVIYVNGDFKVDGVEVELNSDESEKICDIYEYLENLKYINITVYAKSD